MGKIYYQRCKTQKYGNKKVIYDCMQFDSIKEMSRYVYLKQLENDKEISNLQRQVSFELIPAQYEPTEEVYKKGKNKGQVKRGKLLERKCEYIADFVYEKNGQTIVEDVKGGVRTKDYIIKRKLMLHVHGIKIIEV